MPKKKHTEKEFIRFHQKNMFTLDRLIEQKQFSLEELGDMLPGLFHINDGETLANKFISTKADDLMVISSAEIIELGERFLTNYLSQHTLHTVFPRINEHFNAGDKHAIFTDFQFFRRDMKSDEYHPLLTSCKISPNGKDFITLSIPFSNYSTASKILEKAIEYSQIADAEFEKFQSLTKREKQILKLIAEGWTNKQIGNLLFISEHTVRTHRNRIFKKLDIKNIRDAIRYGEIFDLINKGE